MRYVFCLSLIIALFGGAQAACPSPESVAALASQWRDMQPISGLDKDMSPTDAACARQLLVGELVRSEGRIVGYKAGLTNAAVQKRFGTDAPVRGILFEKMLLADGAELPAKFGTRPVFEADLVVEVKDEGINQARTPAEVLPHLSALIPFIELPDLLLDPGETPNSATLTAINAGARLGILGRRIAPMPAHLDTLASMSVVVRDVADGNRELARGPGSAILEHPLNAVIWLARDLARNGRQLKAGDLLSLGSFMPLMPPKPGMNIRVSYEGLPGMPGVGVKFK
ncbi:hypothetical protein LZ012_02115 [Dechloromonas sp. XY25]|uniref:Hydratase n=1 Tax=Dechloromonas hankyongensis TaxID=2908002 RepID=A0ABS9JY07_9RHOO|nr:hypothetical protein [Dechloromonas hankyongensis]MCG2575786.1 hypothetical protein [Dechloromonas hankyongensis]